MGDPIPLVVSAILTFAQAEPPALALELELSASATVALDWGGARLPARSAGTRHRFGPLPLPRGGPVAWSARGARGALAAGEVPDFEARPLRVAVFGADGTSLGPHASLAAAVAEWRPHLVLATRRPSARDRAAFLRATSPVARSAPLVLPSPGAPREIRLGPLSLRVAPGPGTFEAPSGAAFDLVLLEAGPLSSGAAEPGAVPLEVLVEARVDLVVSGRDAFYERLGRERTTLLVSGGGRARLDAARRVVVGSAGAVAAHHWVGLEITAKGGRLRAWSLDGLLLDAARIPPPAPYAPVGEPLGLVLGLGAVLLGLAAALVLLVR